jgi:flagella basal body P-ring formation protein FlgA
LGLAVMLALFLIAGTVSAGATSTVAGGTVVTVLPRADVTEPDVTLGDCARIAGPGADRLNRVVVATAPAAGADETLTAPQIAAVLVGLGMSAVTLDGATRCVVHVPAASLDPARIVETAVSAVRAALPSPAPDGGQYVVTALTRPAGLVVPAGPIALVPVVPQGSAGRLGVTTVGVRVERRGRLLRTIPVAVQAALREPVLVAARDLPYHTALVPGDVAAAVRTITSMDGHAVRDPAALAGQWTTQSIAAGTAITDRMVAPEPAVRRGQLVTVVVVRGPLWIGATGRAAQDGIVGQMVRVEIEGTGQIVRARVTQQDTVEVTLP